MGCLLGTEFENCIVEHTEALKTLCDTAVQLICYRYLISDLKWFHLSSPTSIYLLKLDPNG